MNSPDPHSSAGAHSGPADEDIVDVVGEPVSRSQAKNLERGTKLDFSPPRRTTNPRPPSSRMDAAQADKPRRLGLLLAIVVFLLAAVGAFVVWLSQNDVSPPGTETPPPPLTSPSDSSPSPSSSDRTEPTQTEPLADSSISTVPVLTRRRVGECHDQPGSGVYLASGRARNQPAVALASGSYRNGMVAIIHAGTGELLASTGLSGRPAGIGFVQINRQSVLCIPDFRHSRIRYYQVQNRAIAELPLLTRLPGRPVLAAFAGEEGLVAALCRSDSGLVVVLVRATNHEQTETLDSWAVDGELRWRDMFLFERGIYDAPLPVLIAANGEARLLQPDGVVDTLPAPQENAVCIAVSKFNGSRRFYALFASGNETSAYVLDLSSTPEWQSAGALPNRPLANGLATGKNSVYALTLNEALFFPDVRDSNATWLTKTLPSPSTNPASPVLAQTDQGEELVYTDGDCAVWAIGLSTRPDWQGARQSAAFAAAGKQVGESLSIAALTAWTDESIAHLVRSLPERSEQSQMQVVWFAQAAPDQIMVEPFYAAALDSTYPQVRREAADALAASGLTNGPTLVHNRMLVETDLATLEHLAAFLGDLPEQQAIDALLAIVLEPAVSPAALQSAAEQLRLLTGECLADEAEPWRKWRAGQE